MNYLVSVVVVNYKQLSVTKKCVDSLLETAYKPIEIILIDNASTRNSFIKLKKIYQKNKNVRLIQSSSNLSLTGGYNLGFKYAKGEKIVFANNDIVFKPDWLTELSICASSPNKILQPKILEFKNKNIIDSVGGKYSIFGLGHREGEYTRDCGQYESDRRIDYAQGTILLFDKKFFLKLGGFDEWFKGHYEDVDICLRAKKIGGESWYCHKSVVYHIGSQAYQYLKNSPKLVFNINKNRLRVILKNFSGIELYYRLCLILIVHFYLIINYHIQGKIDLSTAVIKSIIAAFNTQKKLLSEYNY